MDFDTSKYRDVVESVKSLTTDKDSIKQKVQDMAGGILSEVGIRQLVEPGKQIIKNLLTKKAGLDEEAVNNLLEGKVGTAIKQQADALFKTKNVSVGGEGAEPENFRLSDVLDDKDLFTKYIKNDPEFKEIVDKYGYDDEAIEQTRNLLKDTLSPVEKNSIVQTESINDPEQLAPGYRVLADVSQREYKEPQGSEEEFNNLQNQHESDEQGYELKGQKTTEEGEELGTTGAEAGEGAETGEAVADTTDAALEATDAGLDAVAASTAEIPGVDIITGLAALAGGLATLFTGGEHKEPKLNPSYQFL